VTETETSAAAQNGSGKTINSVASLNKAVKAICNILRRDKAKGARLYVPELTWMLFLQALDLNETREKARLDALGRGGDFRESLASPYRWSEWASRPTGADGVGWKRHELVEEGSLGSFLGFVNDELFPYLRSLGSAASATDRQRVISEIFRNKERTIIASETNLLDALDRVNALADATIDDTHFFTISQAFEGLLPALGEKKNDGGQFFTPREIIRVIVRAVAPTLGKTIYDPCCGTGGFLIEAYKYLLEQHPSPTQIQDLKTRLLWGREDAGEAIPITLANMVLHEIDLPRIWHGNTLTGAVTYGDLFEGAPSQFDYVFTNPPFGSQEGKDAQSRFPYKSSKAQILFLQHIIESLADGGTCGMVIDEGVLFHTKTAAFRQTKRKLLDECNLWAVLSLPPSVFVNAGAGSKTDILFFTKGQPTERVWYYDLSDRHVTKTKPLRFSDFSDFFERLALDPDDAGRVSDRSWWRSAEEIRESEFDLRAANPNGHSATDTRSVAELVAIIRDAQKALEEELGRLGV
jgi:type I restriction enzyme M protein